LPDHPGLGNSSLAVVRACEVGALQQEDALLTVGPLSCRRSRPARSGLSAARSGQAKQPARCGQRQLSELVRSERTFRERPDARQGGRTAHHPS